MSRILVAIANYGTKNDAFLQRLVAEYRSLPHDVHIVVLTNVHKHVEGATEVVVHRPHGDPWTFPFAHKAILSERVDQYDLFIYSEDDTLITLDNIEAFLGATEVLEEHEVAGFLRVEKTPDGRTSVSTINGHFHWDPTSVVRRGQYTFAYFTNEHAASYILTRQQLRQAIKSGGFLVSPHQEKYDLLVTAATDPYTQCGFRKLICISHVERFLIAHLPNKYIGRFGVDVDELEKQISALKEIGEGTRSATVLLETETRLQHQRWSKRLYDAPRQYVINAIAGTTQTLLSYGCGCGSLEYELQARGIEVTAVPLDSVFGACVEAKGVAVVYGNGDGILSSVGSRRFDCILILDILHLVAQPSRLLGQMTQLLTDNGSIVASVPNILQVQTVWRRLKGDPSVTALGDYERTGVHLSSSREMKRWFEAAGLHVHSMDPPPPENGTWWRRMAVSVFPPGFASEFVITGIKVAKR